MSKFDTNPPIKSEAVPVPEWAEEFGEVVISELTADKGNEMAEFIGKAVEGGMSDPELYTQVLAMCCTIGGEVPPVEWLHKVPVRTIVKLGKRALELNGLTQSAQEQAEKN